MTPLITKLRSVLARAHRVIDYPTVGMLLATLALLVFLSCAFS